jgi:hypothetical protein
MKTDIIVLCNSEKAPLLDSLAKADFAAETRLFICGNPVPKLLDKYHDAFAAVITDNNDADPIDYITSFFASQSRAIIMDASAEVSPFVLKYLNSALEFYDNRGVAFISASCPEIEIPLDFQFSSFAMHRPEFFAFATWANVWKKFDLSDNAVYNVFSDSKWLAEFKQACPDLTLDIINAKGHHSPISMQCRLALAACLLSYPTIYPRRSLARSSVRDPKAIVAPLSLNVSLSHFTTGIAQEQDLAEQFYRHFKIGALDSLKSWFLTLNKNRFK